MPRSQSAGDAGRWRSCEAMRKNRTKTHLRVHLRSRQIFQTKALQSWTNSQSRSRLSQTEAGNKVAPNPNCFVPPSGSSRTIGFAPYQPATSAKASGNLLATLPITLYNPIIVVSTLYYPYITPISLMSTPIHGRVRHIPAVPARQSLAAQHVRWRGRARVQGVKDKLFD